MNRLLLSLCLVLLLSSTNAQDSLRVVRPNGGEIFYTNRDSVIIVEWTGVADTTKVRLEYTVDNGATWQTLADSATGLRYDWKQKNPILATTYRIKALQFRRPTLQDDIKYQEHFSDVTDAAWSPDGTRVISAGTNAHVWFARTGVKIGQMDPAAGFRMNTVDWNVDGHTLVTGSTDSTAVLWEDTTFTKLRTFTKHFDELTIARFDVTGAYLATAARDNRGRLFQLSNGSLVTTYTHARTLNDLSWNAQGTKIITCSDDNIGRVWNRGIGLPMQLNGHQVGLQQGCFSPDGTLAATAGGDATTRIWDVANGGALLHTLRDADNEGMYAVTFTPDNRYVVTGMSDSLLILWDATTGARIRSFGGGKGRVTTVSVSQDGQFVAASYSDNNARVFNMATGALVRLLPHRQPVHLVKWSPEGGRVLTTSEDGVAAVWQIRDIIIQEDVSNGTFSIAPPPPASALISTTGDTVSIGDDFTVNVDMSNGLYLDIVKPNTVTVTVMYDGSIMDLKDRTVVESQRDSLGYAIVTLKPVPLPYVQGPLYSLPFKATLGADSVTRVRVTSALVDGAWTLVRIDTVSREILVRGQCREGGVTRLYISDSARVRFSAFPIPAEKTLRIHASLLETGPTSVTMYDMFGRTVYSDVATSDEEKARTVERMIDVQQFPSGRYVMVLTTPTDRKVLLVVKD
jgi:WD40 repeat protein